MKQCDGVRRAWVTALASVCLLTASVVAADNAAGSRPNLLVILVDDLGWGDLGCYGADDLQTPHVDGLAARGLRFTSFYANCSVCSPTRAALVTGRYPSLVGVPGVIRTNADNSWGYLSPDAVLLPKLLTPAGYHTALVGKWHLGLEAPNRPHDRGFDLFHGFLGDMMEDYYHHRRCGHNYMRRNDEVIDPKGHATDLFTQWACDYIRRRSAKPEPFFLLLAYNAPHTPIQPPDDWLAKVKKRRPDLDPARAKIVAFIEHLDDGIGRVLAALKSTGLDKNTLVVFTSDNGGYLERSASNGPWRSGKQSMYEGGLRVPTVAVWPGRIAPTTTTDRPVMTMDLFPTLVAAAGVEMKLAIDGISFLPALLGKQQPIPKRDLFFRRREGGLTYGGKTIEAVRRGDWKLLQNTPWSPLELYNLRDDPYEKNNLTSQRPAEMKALNAALRKHIQRGGAVPWQKGGG